MKIDILKSVKELMGLGLTWEAASCAVRYFDGMLQADRNRLAAARKARRGRNVRECPRMSADIGEKQAGNSQKRLAAVPARPLTRSLSSEDISFSEQKKIASEEVSKKEKRKKSASPFPEGFKPKDSHYARGASLGFSPAFVDELAEDIALWARAKGERKACWDSAFHRWIRTSKKQQPQQKRSLMDAALDWISEGDDGKKLPDGNSNVVKFLPATGREQ